jgi:hypothetical protein
MDSKLPEFDEYVERGGELVHLPTGMRIRVGDDVLPDAMPFDANAAERESDYDSLAVWNMGIEIARARKR